MQQSLIQPPAVEPVSVDQAICHLRESDGTAQTDLIKRLIRTARQYVEDYTRHALVRQVVRFTATCFQSVIELPLLGVRSVDSIQYVDTAGATQTLATSIYQVDYLTSDRVRIMPAYGEVWPSVRNSTFNAVIITCTAGHAVPFSTNYSIDANQCDATAHPLSNGDVVKAWTTGEALPDPLEDQQFYFVVNATTDAFELAATSGGAPITFSADSKGQAFAGEIPEALLSAMLLLIGHWYEHREQSITGTIIADIPRGVESLLLPHASVRF